MEDVTSFNKTEGGQDVPLKLDKNMTLLDTHIQCVNLRDQINAYVHLDVDTHIDAQVKYGYSLVGSLVPFKLRDVGDRHLFLARYLTSSSGGCLCM